MEHSSFGIQCKGKESFSVGCSYKIRRDKVELLNIYSNKYMLSSPRTKLIHLIKIENFPRTICIGTK